MPILSVPLGIPRTKKETKKHKNHRSGKKSSPKLSITPPLPKYIEPSPPPIITDYIKEFSVIIIQSSIRTYLQKQNYKKLLDNYIPFPLKKKNKKRQLLNHIKFLHSI
jgi:hypothetical protein